MGLLIITLAINVAWVLFVIIILLPRIERELKKRDQKIIDELMKLSMAVQHQFRQLEKQANPPAHVSDPFKRPKEQYETTRHIVVPKTPDEIRNENFEEIKKGAEYGHID